MPLITGNIYLNLNPEELIMFAQIVEAFGRTEGTNTATNLYSKLLAECEKCGVYPHKVDKVFGMGRL